MLVPEVKSLRLQAEWVMGLPVGSMASQDRITGLPSQLPNNPLKLPALPRDRQTREL